MLKIDVFQLGPMATNAYLLTFTGENKGIIIDPGMNPKPLLRKIEGLEIEAILLTHAHFDHIGGLEEVRKLKGCPVYIHDLEADWLVAPDKNGSSRWPDVTPPISAAAAEYALDDKQELKLLGRTFRVIHTPGHSPGSVSFLFEDHLFSGDVLFRLSVGRSDLPGSSFRDLHQSIHSKLFKLDNSIHVHPGHGPKTTIGYERANNPHV